ncbi:CHRD domain-containing protein [Streptomyces sp. ALI-76-A]|uniref:CHRD domain-containing protein n=1 Tax=Streptomyces sp. ALI-76-A TaxID=3025736 RepID=UPI00256F3A4A|nr:CHRD domain-containing protein [Streptomyces sp. ALI-76-A]MDL5203147.1 CHRD domain-containing protein [Streptomyces sp. ALI-76-A]
MGISTMFPVRRTSRTVRTSRTRRTGLLVTTVAVAASAVVAAVTPASAGDGRAPGGGTGADGVLLAASLRGANEVPTPGGPAVGDKDGAALQFVKVKGDKVSVAVKWRGTGRPTALHLHQGARGSNGAVKIDFTGLLKSRGPGRTVTGTVQVDDPALLDRLTSDPTSFYANLHTARFPGGAVRGRLHRITVASFDFRDALDNVQASVLKGRQIYACKPAADGGYAFAQRDVSAVLGGAIAHSFVAPDSGTPQWIAPDRSAVTGAVLSRTPNGDGNIPELDLRATSSGKERGLLAGTTEILRLNTVGGVAPAGPCTPGAVVGVPYQADYVFLGV